MSRSHPSAQRRRRLVGLVACALLAVAPPAVAADPPTIRDLPDGSPPPATEHGVTLITGDEVSYTPRKGKDPLISVELAPRSDGRPVEVVTQRRGDSWYVTPSDARPYVDSGRLDPELFDVTSLVEQGLTDALPVIVEHPEGSRPAAAVPLANADPVPVVNGIAGEVDGDDAASLWAAIAPDSAAGTARLAGGVTAVHLDQLVELSLDESVPQVGAPQAWEAGLDGAGVTVAVLDSGIDETHADLAGQVVGAKSFVDGEGTDDLAGHGTHVAATIASSGAGADGKYTGVAPGAELLNGKVCNQYAQCAVSWILNGMDWAAHSGASVINMSLGGDPTDGTDLMAQALNDLSAETGALFVVAAGNAYDNLTVSTPGTADAALTVGAVDDADEMADFSSRGPRLGDGAVKPEIVAPGVSIFAARAANGFPQVPPEAKYVGLSGTSMATPHVAGAAAILAQARPEATARQLKDALVSSSLDTGAAWHEQGAGRLDVPAALDSLAAVSAPATVTMGRIAGPTDATVTYTNASDDDVTLQLGYHPKGWDGRDGTASLSAADVTVPAGGSADVRLTVDPAVGEPGLYGGVLTATDGTTSLRTPISWYTPYPPRDTRPLEIEVVDSDGDRVTPAEVTTGQQIYVLRDTSPAVDEPNDPFADATSMFYARPAADHWVAEVPEGSYAVYFTDLEVEHDKRRVSLLSATGVDVTGPRTVTLDARDAVRSGASVGEDTYDYDRQIQLYAQGGNAGLVTSWSASAMEDLEIYATPARATTPALLKVQQNFTLASRFVRMRAFGRELDTQFDPYLVTRELTGRHRLPVVYAGSGSPEELDGLDVEGKAVLVRLPTPARSGWNGAYDAAELAATAADHAAAAGAVAVLPYLDTAGALPTVPPSSKGPGTTVPIPILSLSNTDGERLRLAHRPRIDLAVERNPERMYVLHFAPEDGVPSHLTHRVGRRSLEHVRSRFHADVPGLALFQWWWGQRLFDRVSASTNPYLFLQAPAAIDHFVGPMTSDQRWHRTSTLQEDGGDGRFEQVDETRPRDEVEDWFAGPLAASSPLSPHAGYAGYMRLSDRTLYSTPFLTDSTRGHYTAVDWGAYPFTHRLFELTDAGEREIAGQGSPVPSFPMPDEPGRFRMESTYDLPDTDWQGPSKLVRAMSPRVENVWTFRSGPPTGTDCARPSNEPCEVMPLIQLTYELGLDLRSRVPAGRPHAFRVSAASSYGSIAGGRVDRLSMSYSVDDGDSWDRALVIPVGDGEFLVLLKHPRLRDTSGYVSLRAWAHDTEGGTVRQTVQRAYQLH